MICVLLIRMMPASCLPCQQQQRSRAACQTIFPTSSSDCGPMAACRAASQGPESISSMTLQPSEWCTIDIPLVHRHDYWNLRFILIWCIIVLEQSRNCEFLQRCHVVVIYTQLVTCCLHHCYFTFCPLFILHQLYTSCQLSLVMCWIPFCSISIANLQQHSQAQPVSSGLDYLSDPRGLQLLAPLLWGGGVTTGRILGHCERMLGRGEKRYHFDLQGFTAALKWKVSALFASSYLQDTAVIKLQGFCLKHEAFDGTRHFQYNQNAALFTAKETGGSYCYHIHTFKCWESAQWTMFHHGFVEWWGNFVTVREG